MSNKDETLCRYFMVTIDCIHEIATKVNGEYVSKLADKGYLNSTVSLAE